MLSLQEKIDLILNSNSLNDVPREALPSSHKEDYYFVSYSHKDYKKVLKDILLLETYGINIWYDDEMHIGENWKEVAELYISKYHCKGIIFYLSENSIASSACNEEIEYVLKKNKSFFSINMPKENEPVESGLAMLKRYGLDTDKAKLELFEKAFPNEVLYLSYNDSIERKVHEISRMVGADLLTYRMNEKIEATYEIGVGKQEQHIKVAEIEGCNDNQIIKLRLPETIYHNEEEVEVNRILSCVFANCINLEEVNLPSTISIIDEYAFKNCINLQNINLENVRYIERYCFANCKNLKLEEINSFLGEYAFLNCDSLVNIELTNSHNTDIPKGCFLNCKNLKSIATRYIETFDEGIGEEAFKGCSSLEFVNLGDVAYYVDTAKINNEAFKDCVSLKEINLRGPWKLDGNFIFENCTSLKKVKLDKGIDTLSAGAFKNCSNLKTISGFKSIKHLNGGSIFYNTPFLQNIDLSNIKVINGRALYGLDRTDLYFKNLIQTKGNIIEGVSNLKTITVGDKLEILMDDTFTKCDTLEEVTLGKKVKDIWFDALSNNKNLHTLRLNSECEIQIDGAAFNGSPLINIIVEHLPAVISVLKQVHKYIYLYVSKNVDVKDYKKYLNKEQFELIDESELYNIYKRNDAYRYEEESILDSFF